MSSNFRFFLQFVCEGLANAGGTRATSKYYQRLNNVAIRERVNNQRVTNEQFQQSPQMIEDLKGKQTLSQKNNVPTSKKVKILLEIF